MQEKITAAIERYICAAKRYQQLRTEISAADQLTPEEIEEEKPKPKSRDYFGELLCSIRAMADLDPRDPEHHYGGIPDVPQSDQDTLVQLLKDRIGQQRRLREMRVQRSRCASVLRNEADKAQERLSEERRSLLAAIAA